MPIHDQGYQHWQGTLRGPIHRWWAIARRGCIIGMRTKWMKSTLFMAFIPALLLVTALALWGLVENRIDWLITLLQSTPLGGLVKEDPKQYRTMIWTLAYDYFFQYELFFAVVLLAMVGPDLISQDLRFNAIPLYLSKPVRRIDYFMGKLGVIAVFLSAVMIAPAILAYIMGLLFSLDYTVIGDTYRLLFASIFYGVIVVISAGTLMLAISSLTKNARIVGGIWVGFLVISANVAFALEMNTRQQWCPLISYGNNIYRIQTFLLDTPGAWKQVLDLSEKLTKQAEMAAAAANMMGGPSRGFPLPAAKKANKSIATKTPNPPQPPADSSNRRAEIKRRQELRRKSFLEERSTDKFPWYWSAGVLGGLFGLSAFILSRRVRSLDSLR